MWKQFAVAVAALVQTLRPCLFLSISHAIRQLGPTSVAFHFFVISLFLLHVLRRSASNACDNIVWRHPTHSTSASSSEGLVQQALDFYCFVISLFLFQKLRRSASNACNGNCWRHPTHSTAASSWDGRPPSTPCALHITHEAALMLEAAPMF